jgi:hypothetical protein
MSFDFILVFDGLPHRQIDLQLIILGIELLINHFIVFIIGLIFPLDFLSLGQLLLSLLFGKF